MDSVLGIFASIDDPRDHTARYELPAPRFIALAATLAALKTVTLKGCTAAVSAPSPHFPH